ncbi:MAG: PilN domain-containing protein [Azoarcus sp.]|jgi:MSHA biogenesis protein MshI|nr:PilN domain-containing protein [Azoarcus sp.]
MSQQINLLNPALRPRREWLSLETLILSTAALLVVMIGIGAWGIHRERQAMAELNAREVAWQDAQSQLKDLATQQVSRSVDAQLVQQVAQRKTWLEHRRQALSMLQGGSMGRADGFSNIMAALARQTPEGLWLTGFDIQTGGNAILLRGRLVTENLLPSFVERLNHEADLRGRRFAALEVVSIPPKPRGDDSKPDERTTLERSGWLEFVLRGDETPSEVAGVMKWP